MLKQTTFWLFAMAVLFASPLCFSQTVLFTDGFDSADSENNFDILVYENPEDPDGFQHFWEFVDYSDMGISPAPNSTDGSTTGVQVYANVGGYNTADVINFYTSEEFSGNIRASVDVYMNFIPETSGTTENFNFGIYQSGDLVVSWEGFVYAPDSNDLPSQSDGYFFSMNSDGDSGSRGDYLFTEGFPEGSAGANFSCGEWAVADPAAISDCRVLLESNGENNDALFAELFPGDAADHFIGSPGNRWVTVSMEYVDGTVTVFLNGVQVHTYTDPDMTYTSGRVLIAHEDPFGSNGEDRAWALWDNFVVEQLETSEVNTWSLY